MYYIYKNTNSSFGKNIHWLVRKGVILISAKFLGFRTENVITRTPYSRFARNSQERYSNFEAQVPVKPEKIKLSYEIGLGKCKNSAPACFRQKYSNMCIGRGTQNRSFGVKIKKY